MLWCCGSPPNPSHLHPPGRQLAEPSAIRLAEATRLVKVLPRFAGLDPASPLPRAVFDRILDDADGPSVALYTLVGAAWLHTAAEPPLSPAPDNCCPGLAALGSC